MSPTFEDEEGRGYILQAALLDSDGNVLVVIGEGPEFTNKSRLYFAATPNTGRERYLAYVPTYFREVPQKRRRARSTERSLTPYDTPWGELPLRAGAMGDDETAALVQQCTDRVIKYVWRPRTGAFFPEGLYLLGHRMPRHDWADACFVLGRSEGQLEIRLNPAA